MRHAALALVLLATAPALAGVTLEYGYKPGLYTATIRQSTVMTVSAEDPDTQARLGAMNPIEQQMTMILEQRFEAIEGSADHRVTSTMTDVEISTTLGGQPAPVGLNAMMDMKGFGFSGIMDPRGEIHDVEVTNIPSGLGMEEAFAEQMGKIMAQSYPPLPEGELEVGESFDYWIDMPLPVPGVGEGGKPLQLRVTLSYTLRGFDDEVARLDVLQTISVVGTAEEISMNVEGEGGGEALFDLEGGYFRENDIEMDAQILIGAPERVKMQMTSESSVTLGRTG